MRFCNPIRYALTTAAALLAACGTLPQSNAPGATRQSSTVAAAAFGAGRTRLSQSYHVLYRFNLRHGVGSGRPSGGLLGTTRGLFGTTQLGGKPGRGGCCGTVYSITASGTYNTVYEFRGEGDGASPRAGVTNVGGTLYGTTASGGTSNQGTVYSVSTSGVEKVLHSFSGGADGALPTTSLFYYAGTNKMYGTTTQGGAGAGCGSSGCGTVYSITTSGVEKVLYAFKGGSDGATPSSTLIVYTDNAAVLRGRVRTLYGTTSYGGGTGCGGSGCGTVYGITTSGQEKVVYGFKGGRDGSQPEGLDDDRGTLLGTTVAGGRGCKGSGGCGTVYSITPFGIKKAVYNFRGGSDGACPNGPLIDISGKAYGTTTCGGGCSTEPCGTVYKMTLNGTKVVLYRFTDPADGFSPSAPLIDLYPTLYGTTLDGGSGKGDGHGVVFSVPQ